MSRISILALLSLLGLALAPVRAQNYMDEDQDRPTRREAVPSAGLFPTQRMMELFIDRLVEDDLADTYGLDEDQIYNVQDTLRGRFPAWLQEHRGEIMQLSNEYFEALLNNEPPSAEQVAVWAQRVLPLMDGFMDQFEGSAEDMRQFLTDDQQIIMDGQLAAFRVGMNFMTQRVGEWSEGGFDPEIHWIHNASAQQYQRDQEVHMQQQMDEAKREAMGEAAYQEFEVIRVQQRHADRTATPRPANDPKLPQDEWTRYTEDFIRRYDLNQDQQNQAHRILFALQEQRNNYLRRETVRKRIDEAEKLLKAAETDEQRAQAQATVESLKRPLERMFKSLKERLDKLPTRAQRAAVLAKEKEKSPTTQPADDETGAKRESPSSP
ncbi:MAG: hypothetical protein PVJ57_00390 [Phycisphaerae bacterium]|jgi:hypothetical protein